jgi:hypothetical protein
MELNIETISAIVTLVLGGTGIGSWLGIRYAKRRALADTKTKEAEAKKAEAEALKEKQDYYQQLIEDLAKDRDYYKVSRDEQRTRLDEMDDKMRRLQDKVARNGRMVEVLRPFICTNLDCQLRQHGVISADGEVRITKTKTKTKTDKSDEILNT